MEEFYFSVNLDSERTLCLAPLTDRKITLSGQEIADTSGHFLFEQHGSGESVHIEIIAQVVSVDAVMRLRDMFRMA
jgi:hypothetical protein